MANELSINNALTYAKNNATVTQTPGTVTATVTGNGLAVNVAYSVPTTSTALPLGSVTSPGGWLWIQNTDPTNYVKIQAAVSGTEFARLLPGDPPQSFRLAPGITAVALQANAAACVVKYSVFDL